MAFDPSKHLTQLKGKDYLEVKYRLQWFHEATSAKAGYVTVETSHEVGKAATFFTVAWNGEGEEWRAFKARGIEIEVCGRVATGEGSETKQDFNDYYEKAATKSLGRALAGLGFGTQFAPELEEGEREGEKRVVDSPVQRQESKPTQAQTSKPAQQPQKPQAAKAPAQPAKQPLTKTLEQRKNELKAGFAALGYVGTAWVEQAVQATGQTKEHLAVNGFSVDDLAKTAERLRLLQEGEKRRQEQQKAS